MCIFHIIDTVARSPMDVDQAVADIVEHLKDSFLISDLQKSLKVKIVCKKTFQF